MTYEMLNAIKHEIELCERRKEALNNVILLFSPLPPARTGPPLAAKAPAPPQIASKNGQVPSSSKDDLVPACIEAIRSFGSDEFMKSEVAAWVTKHRAHLGKNDARFRGAISRALALLRKRGLVQTNGGSTSSLRYRRLPAIDQDKDPAPVDVEARYREFRSGLKISTNGADETSAT